MTQPPIGMPPQINPAKVAEAHPVDPGNALVVAGRRPQCVWVAVQGQDAEGPVLVLTIRTDTTTFTLRLSRDNAEAFGSYVSAEARKLSPLLVPGPLG